MGWGFLMGVLMGMLVFRGFGGLYGLGGKGWCGIVLCMRDGRGEMRCWIGGWGLGVNLMNGWWVREGGRR